jgi:4-diphosphocytidyl-2-C-methyl-D-erythritol kinase
LRIVGRRPNGYHLLTAEMVTVDLCDELEFSGGDGFEVVDAVDWVEPSLVSASHLAVRFSPAGGAPNLVKLALAVAGTPASVRLTKRIPTGAGLGGGSADAAAVLRWAGISGAAVAARLGADVPFCLIGGRALVSGIGEIVEPLADQPADFLLVSPRLQVSTSAVYAAWDSLDGPVGELDNDLEPAALVVEPRLEWWRDLIADVSGRRPRLAGSGGTWWLEGDRVELAELQRALSGAVVEADESALVRCVRTISAS